MIVGIAETLGIRVGYIKPFGDRLLYRKKRLWDYDAALLTNLFDLDENPEDISLGLDHSKLRYMYDEESTIEKLEEMIERVGSGRDVVFIEGGMGLTYGSSVHLDPVFLARRLDAELMLVAGGDVDTIMDDLTFIHRTVDLDGLRLAGVIINKVRDVPDFRSVHLDEITSMGFKVLGNVAYLSHVLFAKVLAGERNLSRMVRHIFVGAMSGQAALANPLFKKEAKLIITSGDRTDMIQAAIDSDAAAIILTNNIPPPPLVISKAEDRGIPLLLVPQDTHQTARSIDGLEPLLTVDDERRASLLGELVRKHVDL